MTEPGQMSPHRGCERVSMSDSSTMTADQWRDRLMIRLAQQRDLLARLQRLADQQSAMIRSNKVEALLGLLNERQRLIDSFLALQRETNPLLNECPRRMNELNAADRESVRTAIGGIDGQLDAVLKRDEEDRKLLEEARSATKGELGALSSAKQARHAYLTPGKPSSNRFADQRG